MKHHRLAVTKVESEIWLDSDQKSEIRNQKSDIRNQKSENLKSEIRNQKSETGNQKPEIRNQKPEIRNQKSQAWLQLAAGLSGENLCWDWRKGLHIVWHFALLFRIKKSSAHVSGINALRLQNESSEPLTPPRVQFGSMQVEVTGGGVFAGAGVAAAFRCHPPSLCMLNWYETDRTTGSLYCQNTVLLLWIFTYYYHDSSAMQFTHEGREGVGGLKEGESISATRQNIVLPIRLSVPCGRVTTGGASSHVLSSWASSTLAVVSICSALSWYFATNFASVEDHSSRYSSSAAGEVSQVCAPRLHFFGVFLGFFSRSWFIKPLLSQFRFFLRYLFTRRCKWVERGVNGLNIWARFTFFDWLKVWPFTFVRGWEGGRSSRYSLSQPLYPAPNASTSHVSHQSALWITCLLAQDESVWVLCLHLVGSQLKIVRRSLASNA